MNSFEYINELYRPYKVTKKGNCTIIESTSGKFVIKKKAKKDITELQNYLKNRNFFHFATIKECERADVDIFEYQDSFDYAKEQKALDLIKIVAELHNKTSYIKEVREDKFKELYENIKNNLIYYEQKFKNYIVEIENKRFMSPSHYLFIRNSTKIFNQINFCNEKLDEWYDGVREKKRFRVCIVHNNLELNHYIRGEKDYLISWDKYIVDTPILDIYNLFKKEFLNLEFSTVLETYLKKFSLSKEELDLLLIMLCLPNDIEFNEDEYLSTCNVSKALDFIYKTELTVRPYYLEEN